MPRKVRRAMSQSLWEHEIRGRRGLLTIALVVIGATVVTLAFGVLDTGLKQGVARHRMVRSFTDADALPEMGPLKSKRVLDALGNVPREKFVRESERDIAYENRPLPANFGQTLSQPSLTGHMLELLDLQPGDRLLQLGVGTGYEAALASEIVGPMAVVESSGTAADAARQKLQELGYGEVTINTADVFQGWAPNAPYDAIYVRGAVLEFADAWRAQLNPGGRMIAPIGSILGEQTLTLVEKLSDGSLSETDMMPVRFRPLDMGDEEGTFPPLLRALLIEQPSAGIESGLTHRKGAKQ